MANGKVNQRNIDLAKEMRIYGIQMHGGEPSFDYQKHFIKNHIQQSRHDQIGRLPSSTTTVSPQMDKVEPRIAIQDILNIPNFEQKRIKLEALVINATTDMKQIEENMQLVITHQLNFLDNDLYKELVKKKERLLTDLQIFESYRKMFEEEEKVRRLIQQSQDDAMFHKNIRLPPGDSYIPPTTRSSLQSKSGEERLTSLAPSSLVSTVDPSFIEVQHPLQVTRQHQVYESSPWNIATNVLGMNAEYKGACPKCGKITNYYNDVCHHCKQEIPLNIKLEVLPSPSPATPGKQFLSLGQTSSRTVLQVQAAPATVKSGGGIRPKANREVTLSPNLISERHPKKEVDLETQKK